MLRHDAALETHPAFYKHHSTHEGLANWMPHTTLTPQKIVNKIIIICTSQFLNLLIYKNKPNNGMYMNVH